MHGTCEWPKNVTPAAEAPERRLGLHLGEQVLVLVGRRPVADRDAVLDDPRPDRQVLEEAPVRRREHLARSRTRPGGRGR